MPLVSDIITLLEQLAPPRYQEDYDNAGLITGQPQWACTGVLTCLDATETVLDEALARGCNLVVAHHPIVFRGLKRINGRSYVERVLIKAIKHDVAIYAIHTNLDNVYHRGVNARMAERLGLLDTRILAPKRETWRLTAFLPTSQAAGLREALGDAVVHLGHAEEGLSRLEAWLASGQRPAAQAALHQAGCSHYSFSHTDDLTATVGSGLVGRLPEPLPHREFLALLARQFLTPTVRHTAPLERPIHTVALCGGAGSFLLGQAVAQQADAFVTADYKYHEFFDADGRILIADIGHFESEQFTSDLLYTIIRENFGNFAVYCAQTVTNPVHYFITP